MASKEFMGFSEEELQLIKKQTSEPELNNVGLMDKIEYASGKHAKFEFRKPKKLLAIDKHLQLLEVKFNDSSIKPDQKLFRSASEGNDILSEKTETHGQSTLLRVDSESQRYELLPSPGVEEKRFPLPPEALDICLQHTPAQELLAQTVHTKTVETNQVVRCESKLMLEEFEQRQRHLESENAKRKALLLKAIDDRKKHTREESQKILKIQGELGQLDSLLSSDVAILRSQIEEASLDFDKAQKRYERAEKEFVEAKLCIFQRMERKERLTEHLCTIIEQNEARKAHKLSEMMEQLGLEVLLDNCRNAGNGFTTLLPHLCALNEVSYKSCQTLKPQTSLSDAQVETNNNNNNLAKLSEDCQTKEHLDN